jgi:selenocysteine lyase/cysteine desulfurase
MQLLKRFFEGLKPMEGNISIHGPCEPEAMLPTISISVNGMDNGIVARRLNDDFGICCRMGLHCAPSAHRTLGTFPQGTLRLSFGFFNTDVEIENVVRALKTISCP